MGRRAALLATLLLTALALAARIADAAPAAGASRAGAPTAAAATPAATVDFAQPVPLQPSMAGFLHSLRASDPPDHLVAPLRPGTWRGIPRTVDFRRAFRLGARPMLVLSDLWGYPDDGYNGHGPPWVDLDRWGRFVEQTAQRIGGRVMWDVWNEPDSPAFWSGTPEQFAQVFAVAQARLKATLGPGATVAGPGYSHYDGRRLRAFLDQCRMLGCRPDVLTWHEFPSERQSIASIVSHLRDAKLLTGLPVVVGETVGPADQDRPGALVGYLFALERGGAAGAARGCFPAPGDHAPCSGRTLDGLLTHGRATSSWWTTATYAAGVPQRVRTVAQRAGAAALGARCADNRTYATVLLGRESRPASPGGWDVTLRGLRALPCVGRASALRVRMRRLPAQGRTALDAPRWLGSRRLRVDLAGTAVLHVPAVGPHDAVVVELAAGPPLPARR